MLLTHRYFSEYFPAITPALAFFGCLMLFGMFAGIMIDKLFSALIGP
jgi:hypothetical protein